MEKTKEALRILITGESNAVKQYNLFAQKAIDEGFPNTSYLFSALAGAENIHIKNHLNALKEDYEIEFTEEIFVSSTLNNLLLAIESEVKETKIFYPKLIKSIKKELNSLYGKTAKLSMNWAQKVEKEHAHLLKKAYKSLKKGFDIDITNIYICQVCGNILLNTLTNKECVICGHDVAFFDIYQRKF